MENNRLPHAVVLESKKSSALNKYTKMISQWAVCNNEKRPCKICSQCIKVEKSIHPDVYTAKLSGKNEIVNVDEIRSICSDVYIKPNESNIKVYIIPNADKMQHQAQNAFLKVLEEPPQNILFVLCCSSSQGLLGTILSRATVYKLDENDESSESESFREIAEEIAEAVPENRGYNLLCKVGQLKDRVTARCIVDILLEIFHNALKSKVSDYECNGVENRICSKIDAQEIISIIDALGEAKGHLSSNANMNLFTAWLCARLRRRK